eukprot:SAG11_NODE_13187_length_666_cov_1.040564_1_plen_62_part_00
MRCAGGRAVAHELAAVAAQLLALAKLLHLRLALEAEAVAALRFDVQRVASAVRAHLAAKLG